MRTCPATSIPTLFAKNWMNTMGMIMTREPSIVHLYPNRSSAVPVSSKPMSCPPLVLCLMMDWLAALYVSLDVACDSPDVVVPVGQLLAKLLCKARKAEERTHQVVVIGFHDDCQSHQTSPDGKRSCTWTARPE